MNSDVLVNHGLRLGSNQDAGGKGFPNRSRQGRKEFLLLELGYAMSRTSIMTIGFLLILIGIKLSLVESYVLSQSATKFWMERVEDPSVAVQNNLNPYGQAAQFPSLFQQASFGAAAPAMPQKTVTPPKWACWPTIFFGFVLLLHGISMRRA